MANIDKYDIAQILAGGAIGLGVLWAIAGRKKGGGFFEGEDPGRGAYSDDRCEDPIAGSMSINYQNINKRIDDYMSVKPPHEAANPLTVVHEFWKNELPACPTIAPPLNHPSAPLFREIATMTYESMRHRGITPLAWDSVTQMLSSIGY